EEDDRRQSVDSVLVRSGRVIVRDRCRGCDVRCNEGHAHRDVGTRAWPASGRRPEAAKDERRCQSHSLESLERKAVRRHEISPFLDSLSARQVVESTWQEWPGSNGHSWPAREREGGTAGIG